MSLSAGIVEIWTTTDVDALALEESILSSAELARARAFRRPGDRRLYCAAHVALRRALSRYLACEPAAIGFARSATGKPFVEHPLGAPVHFSLSDTDGMVAVGVSDAPVGVDVERVLVEHGHPEYAEGSLHASEWVAWHACPEPRRAAFLVERWTLKEAYLKGTGEGLYRDPRTLAVGTDDGGVRMQGPASAAEWALRMLAIDEPYRLAVALRGQIREVRMLGAPC